MDLTCPICLRIYFKPIRLPCGHTLCLECLERSLDLATFSCPLCRYRLSVWKRRLKDTSSCIDKDRVNEIEQLFPNYYSARKKGLEVSLNSSEREILHEIGDLNHVNVQFAEPGSIKSEFDAAISRLEDIQNLEKVVQEEASIALSRHLILESSLEGNSLDEDPLVENIPSSVDGLISNNAPVTKFPRISRKQSKKVRIRTQTAKPHTLTHFFNQIPRRDCITQNNSGPSITTTSAAVVSSAPDRQCCSFIPTVSRECRNINDASYQCLAPMPSSGFGTVLEQIEFDEKLARQISEEDKERMPKKILQTAAKKLSSRKPSHALRLNLRSGRVLRNRHKQSSLSAFSTKT